jgi:ABC-type uncharacterized transport system substrate-binding protein
MLVNPKNPNTEPQVRELQGASAALGQKVHLLKASTADEIDQAFVELVKLHVGGLLVGADALFSNRREQIIELAGHNRIPAIYGSTIRHGLMSYGPSFTEGYYQLGFYAGRILKGDKASDLPVQQVTKVELILNLRAAKLLGVKFPVPLLGRADEVIE